MGGKIELLAPAGDVASFTAAVQNGADAVYLGGTLFNARQYASNFDHKTLKEAVDYAHVRGVNVYLTLNTLISDCELNEALSFTQEAYMMGIDGIIVQDIGFASMIREWLPDLELHASTQMTVYNLDGVKTLEKLGFRRVVLARELSLEEIKEIAQNTSLEIEVFIHGALCISYSGQCLLSSIIGGRSGNRGKCAQPCRLPYGIVCEGSDRRNPAGESGKVPPFLDGSYLMSPKDLCSIQEISHLVGTGVKSLKIEGRMKSPEYVATVVRIYRKYLDRIDGDPMGSPIAPEDMEDLAQIFNRGGFSKGYLKGKSGKEMMCFEKPKNWGVYLGKVTAFHPPSRTLTLKVERDLQIGDGIEVWNQESEHPGTVVSHLKAKGKPVKIIRSGETGEVGYVKGRINPGDKVYRTSSKALNVQAKGTFEGKDRRKVQLKGKVTIKQGMHPAFVAWDDEGNECCALAEGLPEKALHRPLTEERVIEQLNKTGNTSFDFQVIDAELDEGLALPVSVLNDLRRSVLDAMEDKRKNRHVRKISGMKDGKGKMLSDFPGNGQKAKDKVKISVLFYTFNPDIAYSSLKADRMYFPFHAGLKGETMALIEQCVSKGKEVFLWIPSITRGKMDQLVRQKLPGIIAQGIRGLMVGNLGSLESTKDFSHLTRWGDYSLNVFNGFSMKQLKDLGLKGVTLSPELTLNQIRKFGEVLDLEKEVLVYGRLAVMTSEYCPVGSILGHKHQGENRATSCGTCSSSTTYKLKDRKGMEFPILCDPVDCRSMLLNSNVMLVTDNLEEIKRCGADWLRIQITDEPAEEAMQIIDMHVDLLQQGERGKGKFEGLIQQIKADGYTKGHYFRGV